MARKYEYRNVGDPAYATYSTVYDRERLRSDILNARSSMHRNLSDVPGLRSELYQLEGQPGKEGFYYHGDARKMKICALQALKQEFVELDRLFQMFRQTKTNEGYPTPPNETSAYPPELQKRLQTAQALESVRLEELTWIKKALEKFENQKTAERDRGVLSYGCRQASSLRNGITHIIDGQLCAVNLAGSLIINDEQSPYDGMLVSDYRSVICKLWREQRDLEHQAELSRAQEIAKLAGQPVPTNIMRKLSKVSKSSLPKWPKGVINQKLIKASVSEPDGELPNSEIEIPPFTTTKKLLRNVKIF